MDEYMSNPTINRALELAQKLPDDLLLDFLAHFFEVGKYLLEELADVLEQFPREDEEWVLEMINQYEQKLAERQASTQSEES